MKKQSMKSRSARDVALDVLLRVQNEAAFSPLALQAELVQSTLSPVDRGLTTELVYGTLQWQGWLDAGLSPLASRGLAKLETWVLILLRMSVYQLACLDKIPAHAAVNEAVQIAKKRGHDGISKLVNGILRSWLRENQDVKPNEKEAALLAHPKWLLDRWTAQWGKETAHAIAESNLFRPAVSVRVNTMKITREALQTELQHAGYVIYPSPISPDGLVLQGGTPIQFTKWFLDGALTLQDESSMVVASAINPHEGSRILDACAAPGGKTTHLVQRMNGKGEVWALDQHAHKEVLIRENALRLRLSKPIHTRVTDAREAKEHFQKQSFDVVLLDAPCSGSGVLRRKPERKWHPSSQAQTELRQLVVLQRELLESLAGLVKIGGIFVYSTCSIDREENDIQVKRFLADHPEFELDESLGQMLAETAPQFDWTKTGADRGILPGMLQLLPHDAESDGFFVARMVRI